MPAIPKETLGAPGTRGSDGQPGAQAKYIPKLKLFKKNNNNSNNSNCYKAIILGIIIGIAVTLIAVSLA